MAYIKLPKETISLIHHIELNKSGWWESAIQRLILAIIWLYKGNPTLQTIIEALRNEYKVNLTETKIISQVESLCSSGILMKLPDETIKISEQTNKELEKHIDISMDLEKKVQNRFIDIVKSSNPSLNAEELWNSFNEECITSLVYELGARVYELVSGSKADLDKSMSFLDFLERCPLENRQSFRNAIIDFLDPTNPDVRAYILRSLNAYFFMEASSLKEDTLEALSKAVDSKPTFNIFIDTNFLFSILELHENPSNKAALSLIKLKKQLARKVNINLYVLPPTIEEARFVLKAAQGHLSGLRLTPNLSEAASEIGLSGLVQKFVEESSKTRNPLKAKDYFDPYISNLITVLKNKTVNYFNSDVAYLKNNSDLKYDLVEQYEFQKKRYGEKAKGDKELEHDLLLWYFIQDKRPAHVDSPLDAHYWIVTVDYTFLGFDAYKRRQSQIGIPLCIHPTTLMQLLQFWVPRTSLLEEAVLSSLRLPFLFHEYDQKAENVTIRILEILGRFENIGDLQKDTIISILLNDALRQKLSAESDIENQVELIQSALMEEYIKTKSNLQKVSKKAQQLEKDKSKKESTINAQEEKLKAYEKRIGDVKLTLRKETKARQNTEEKLEKIYKENEYKKESEKIKKKIRQFNIKWLFFPVLLIFLLGAVISLFITHLLNWKIPNNYIIICGLEGLLWIWLTDRAGLKDSIIKERKFFIRFHKLKVLIFLALGSLILSVSGNAIWEEIKKLLAKI